MRLFVASLLPPEDTGFYDDLGAALVAASGGCVRTVPVGTAHLTLTFLGDTGELSPPTIADTLRPVISPLRPIDVSIGAPEILFARREPRLVMAPVIDGVRPLVDLARAIVFSLRAHPRFALLPLPKAPHVTIARFKRGVNAADAREILSRISADSAQVRHLRLASVSIVESRLGTDGPTYSSLFTLPLNAP